MAPSTASAADATPTRSAKAPGSSITIPVIELCHLYPSPARKSSTNFQLDIRKVLF